MLRIHYCKIRYEKLQIKAKSMNVILLTKFGELEMDVGGILW